MQLKTLEEYIQELIRQHSEDLRFRATKSRVNSGNYLKSGELLRVHTQV